MRKIRSRKAVSPVIATVILVAVAITVAVAVAYWMGGISGQYTKFEKVEISTAYSTKTTGSGWLITLSIKNSGTADSTINTVFVNDRPLNGTAYGQSGFPPGTGDRIYTDIATAGTTYNSGQSGTVQVWIWNDGTNGYGYLSSGTTVNVKLHSAGGMDYIRLVELI